MNKINKSKTKERGKVDFLLILLTVLFFVNLYGTFKYVGVFLGSYIVFKYYKIVLFIDKIQVLLLFFGITYVIFSLFNIDFLLSNVYFFVFLPWLAFTVGKACVLNLRNEKILTVLLLIFSTSVAFIYAFSVVEDYFLRGFTGLRLAELRFVSRTRETLEITATNVGMHIVPLLTFLPVLLFGNNGFNGLTLFLGSVLSILAVLSSTLVSTRTPIVLFGLLLIFVFLYNLKNLSFSKKILTGLIFSIIIYVYQIVDFAATEITSFLYSRFQQKDVVDFGSRLEMWMEGIRNVFLFPWGGEVMRYNYYHNLWLDLKKFGGVVPMILLVVFSVFSIKITYQVLNNTQISRQTRSLLGSMFFVVFAMMFMEPVIEGGPVFFLFYVFLVSFMYHFNLNMQKSKFK